MKCSKTIDIHDGFIDEWYEVGEPSMTVLDCRTWRDRILPDPSNLDFRIWLAWHDESNRIFFAIAAIDDDYVNTHDRSSAEADPGMMNPHDGITFQLDADHSGGTGTQERDSRRGISPHFWTDAAIRSCSPNRKRSCTG